MKKQRKYIVKRVFSFALAITMVLGMAALPSFAAVTAVYSEGRDAAHPAEAAITKVYRMPVGTPTPASKFTFTFEKAGMNTDNPNDPGDVIDDSAAAKNGMADIPPVSVMFAAGEEPSGSAGGTFVDGDTKTVVKQTANFLDGIPSGAWGNKVGVYKYTVSEYLSPADFLNTSYITMLDSAKEGCVFSEAKYDVSVWVDEEIQGTTVVYYPKYIVVQINKDFIDEYYEGSDGGEKINPTPGGNNKTPVTTIEDGFSHVIFTNKYWKTDGGGTDKPGDSAMTVEKLVRGLGSIPSTKFDFTVKVTQSGAIPETQTYHAMVFNKDGADVTDKAGVSLGTKGTIEFVSGIARTGIKLSDQDRLVFVDLHIGSDVEVFDAGMQYYTASYTSSFSQTPNMVYTGIKDDGFGFPNATDKGPHYTAAGANVNKATFVNSRAGATPTGVNVDNLPYIVFLCVVFICFAGYMIYRYRKNFDFDAE